MSHIKVDYTVFNTLYNIKKELKVLETFPVLGFDVETRSAYTPEEIKEAKKLLKAPDLIHPDHLINIKQVAKSSGLSNPSIILTTHFIFGLSENKTVILIAQDTKTEKMLWEWVANAENKLLIHNTGFDLKICWQRTGKLPVNFEDTQLLSKLYLNNAENWKSRVGLKVLMGSYYNPKWSLFEDYSVKDLNNKDFLEYCAIDGASVVKLWNQLQEYAS